MLVDLYSKFTFDYYRATFDDVSITGIEPPSWQDIVEDCSLYFDSPYFEVDTHPVAKQGEKGVKVSLLGRPLFRMCWGGSTFGNRVFIQAEGQSANQVYQWLTASYKGRYSCSRVDVACDSIDGRSFSLTHSALKDFSVKHGIKTRCVGDWDSGVEGRTYYVGAKRPGSFIRFYEKGKQLKSDVLEWVRLEFEISPSDKATKRRLARLNPLEAAFTVPFIGRWLLDNGWYFDGVKSKSARVWKASEMQSSLVHGISQYKRHLRKLADSLPNGYDDLGLIIKDIMDTHDKAGIVNGSISIEDSPTYDQELNPYSHIFDSFLGGA